MQPFLIAAVGMHVAVCWLSTASCSAAAAFWPAPSSISQRLSQSSASKISAESKVHRPHAIYESNCRVASSSLNMSLYPTATATTVALAVGHVLGGSAAVPLVFKATSTWYRKISLPPWTPPDRVFGPVWTGLYACMGIAVSRVLQRLPAGVVAWKSPAVGLWILHYALNLSWAPIFFGAKRLRLGLWINYLLMGTLGAGVIPMFAAIHRPSALLLVPYALWLLYATVLNQAICRRNPTDVYGYNGAKFEDGLIRLQQKAAIYAGLKN